MVPQAVVSRDCYRRQEAEGVQSASGTAQFRAVPIGTEVFEMNEENVQGDKSAAVIQTINADWERRKARVLRSLTETPLDRWLRRRR